MDSLAYEPQKPIPQSKAAHRPVDACVRGGVCGFTAAVADAVVRARAWAAIVAQSQVRKSGAGAPRYNHFGPAPSVEQSDDEPSIKTIFVTNRVKNLVS